MFEPVLEPFELTEAELDEIAGGGGQEGGCGCGCGCGGGLSVGIAVGVAICL